MIRTYILLVQVNAGSPSKIFLVINSYVTDEVLGLCPAHHSDVIRTCHYSRPSSGPEELGLSSLKPRVLGRMPQQASVSREPIKCCEIRSV